MTDVHNTGKGYAFVTFDQKESADSAIREMDGVTLNGQQIKVNEAKPREGGGRGGRGGTTKTFNLRATFYFDRFLMYRILKQFQILMLVFVGGRGGYGGGFGGGRGGGGYGGGGYGGGRGGK